MRTITVALSIACLPFAASSHHSVRAFYDDQNVRQLEGTIASIRWINPHIHFELERINDTGEAELWDVESGSINFLERDGISRGDLAVGTEVTVTGYTSRHGHQSMVASYVTLDNGEDIVLWPGLFGGGTAAGLGRRQASAVPDSADDDSSSLFRVWSVGPDSAGRDGAVLALPLRAEARAAQDTYDPLTDDTALSCIPQGMPGIMDNPFPIEFEDRGSEIILRTEEWDVVRTIYMGGDSDAANQPATPHGYSVGRWEGDTLVIETKNLTDKTYYQGASEHMQLTERFMRVADDVLLYEFTVNDPQAFMRPWTAQLPTVKLDGMIYEFACHETNRGMVGLLSGARAEEAAAREAASE